MSDRFRHRLPRLGLFALNVVICLFLLAPILIVILASFSEAAYLEFPPQALSLKWYDAFFSDDEFLSALWLSVRLAVVVTATSLTIGVAAALGLDRLRRRAVAATGRSLTVAPLLVPAVTYGIAALVFFSEIKLAGTFAGLVAAHTVLALPFVVVIVGAALQSADRSVEEAARNLGASEPLTLLTVTLPLVRSSIAGAAFFAFVTSFDEVTVTLFLSGPRLETLPMKILLSVEYETEPTVAAISTILIAFTAAVAALMSRSGSMTSFLQRR